MIEPNIIFFILTRSYILRFFRIFKIEQPEKLGLQILISKNSINKYFQKCYCGNKRSDAKRTLSNKWLRDSINRESESIKFFLEDVYIFQYKQVLADVLSDMCSEMFHHMTKKTPY